IDRRIFLLFGNLKPKLLPVVTVKFPARGWNEKHLVNLGCINVVGPNLPRLAVCTTQDYTTQTKAICVVANGDNFESLRQCSFFYWLDSGISQDFVECVLGLLLDPEQPPIAWTWGHLEPASLRQHSLGNGPNAFAAAD